MIMRKVVYIVEKDENNKPEALYRYLFEGNNVTAAYLNKLGDWVEDWGLAGILYDLHNPFYAEVSEVDAAKIAKENFGVEFETVQDELIAA